jgi:plastocyanin
MDWRIGVLAAGAVVAVACGGGGSSPTTPSSSGSGSSSGGGSTGGGTTVTITIGSNGAVSPQSVSVPQGGRVTFVNNDSRAHDMASDPHPAHGDCPPLNQVGFLTAGQSRTSGNLTALGTCGFHDHNQPSVTALQGVITVVAP